MKILISTGIFPPKIGGPAQYAKNLAQELKKAGHKVIIKTFDIEDKLPTGVRHLYFFLKIIPSVIWCDSSIILDTYSVGFPTVLACKIFRRKAVIRTGGDFLWEQYVERSKKDVLLINFYDTEPPFFTFKEKIIFKVTKWTIDNATHTIFSTNWQRSIFEKGYRLETKKTSVIENYYGPKESDLKYESRNFIASTRNLYWKNIGVLKEVFEDVKSSYPDIELFLDNLKYEDFMEVMRKSYTVVLVSFGDISPNMIMDAIRYNRPFICTKEVGIYERIKEVGIYVDPLDKKSIKDAILYMLNEENYDKEKEKIRNFNFVHTWNEIADEFVKTIERIDK